MINKYKFLHIFSDGPYTHKFVSFIREHFDENEHFFIILCANKKSKFVEFYNSQNNCTVTQSRNIFFNYKKRFEEAEQVLMHQLNKPVLMATLILFYPSVFNKMVWIPWGADVYFYKYKTNSIKDNFIELLRHWTIKRIPLIASCIKGDYDKIVEVYKSNARWAQVWYPSPVDIDRITKLSTPKSEGKIRVLVGNSADPSNEHIEAFELLEKFCNRDIEIYSILSYGGTKAYVDNVIDEGEKIFGDRFQPVLEYMGFDEYLDFINSVDICVLNHKRQQGLGNQLMFFILKKKVYISDTTTPFKYYKDNSVDVYSTESLKNMNFEDFIFQGEEDKERNRELILSERDDKRAVLLWKKLFTTTVE